MRQALCNLRSTHSVKSPQAHKPTPTVEPSRQECMHTNIQVSHSSMRMLKNPESLSMTHRNKLPISLRTRLDSPQISLQYQSPQSQCQAQLCMFTKKLPSVTRIMVSNQRTIAQNMSRIVIEKEKCEEENLLTGFELVWGRLRQAKN